MTKTELKVGARITLLKDVGFEKEWGIGPGTMGYITCPDRFFDADEEKWSSGYRIRLDGLEFSVGVYPDEIELVTEEEESID